LIKAGWADFRLQDFDHASLHLHGALSQINKVEAEGHAPANAGAMRINALYGLGLVGTVGGAGGGSEEGRRYLQQVIDLDGKGQMAAWAALALVRDKHVPKVSTEKIDIPKLEEQYQEVIAKYPDTPAAEEAFLFRQSLFVETLKTEDATAAIAAIKEFLQTHGKAQFKSALHTLMNQAHVTLKDYPAALQDAIHALETKEIDPSNPNTNNVLDYYRIGLMAECDVGDFATARKYFGKFLAEYPTDQKAFNVKRELARMDQIEKDLRAGKDPFAAAATATAGSAPARGAGAEGGKR
jgi:tetratricopeptide (TPR) repeat protein